MGCVESSVVERGGGAGFCCGTGEDLASGTVLSKIVGVVLIGRDGGIKVGVKLRSLVD